MSLSYSGLRGASTLPVALNFLRTCARSRSNQRCVIVDKVNSGGLWGCALHDCERCCGGHACAANDRCPRLLNLLVAAPEFHVFVNCCLPIRRPHPKLESLALIRSRAPLTRSCGDVVSAYVATACQQRLTGFAV